MSSKRAIVVFLFILWALIATMGTASIMVVRKLNLVGIEAHTAFDHPRIEFWASLVYTALAWMVVIAVADYRGEGK